MGFPRILIFLLCLSPLAAWAQDQGKEDLTGKNEKYEAGFQLGNLLPHEINGVTEILGVGGVRAGYRLSPFTYAEASFITGNGNGVQWKNGSVDVRMDIPVENLVGFAYIGADGVNYTDNTGGNSTVFGGHVGGGIQALLTGHLWFRGDMAFGFSPGQTLFIGFGLTFRFGEAQGT
jgi:hypothetical protein